MSAVHDWYEPDIRSIPCFGCASHIESDKHLFRDKEYWGPSGGLQPRWHPYHLWCVSYTVSTIYNGLTCCICRDSLDLGHLEEAYVWLMSVIFQPKNISNYKKPTLAWRRKLSRADIRRKSLILLSYLKKQKGSNNRSFSKEEELKLRSQMEDREGELVVRSGWEPVHRDCLEQTIKSTIIFWEEKYSNKSWRHQLWDHEHLKILK